MGKAVIWKTIAGKVLAAILPSSGVAFQNNLMLLTGSTNPQSSAIDAPIGSVYFNDSSGFLYRKLDSGLSTNWSQIASNVSQTVVVGKQGAQYATIQGALNAITDASSTKIYAVLIHPGSYVENVTLKPWVQLVGVGNGPTAPLIVGKTTTTVFSPGEICALNRIGQAYTIASDGEIVNDWDNGAVIVNDFFSNITVTADRGFTGVRQNNSTNTTTVTPFYSCKISVNVTHVGTTKNMVGIEQKGNGFGSILGQVTVEMFTKAASGNLNPLRVAVSGAAEYNSTGCIFTCSNQHVGSTATLCGIDTTTASTGFRITQSAIVRLLGNGAAARGFCLSANASAEIFHTSATVFIAPAFGSNGFISDTASTDTQLVWLNSSNRDLTKTGLGVAAITPYDEVRTGFDAWGGSGNYWSFVPATGAFTLLRRGVAIIRSTPLLIPGGQVLSGGTALVNNAVNFVYADSTGTLKSTTTNNSALYEGNSVLFQVFTDGTNFLVKKENHPVGFPTVASGYIHKVLGSQLENNGGANLTALVPGNRTLKMATASTAIDHGLEAVIPDSGSNPLTFWGFFTSASGPAIDVSAAGVTAIPSRYQNTGTTVTNALSNERVVMRVGVVLDSLNSSAPQYVFQYHNGVFGNSAAAANAIASNSIQPFSQALLSLEVIQLGFICVTANGSGGGTLDTAVGTNGVVISKQVFGSNFAAGALSTGAGSVIVSTTNFGNFFSGTETSAQLCLDRLDDFSQVLPYTTGVEYRVGNTVKQNGGIYRCTTLVGAGSNTAWGAVYTSFEQLTMAKFADVATAEAALGVGNDLCYVVATETLYRFEVSGSSFTDDNLWVLSTGVGGDTRWLGVAGKYDRSRKLSELGRVIAAGGSIDLSSAVGSERSYAVIGDAVGQNAMSSTPFTTTATPPAEPMTVWLIGINSTYTVTLSTNDAAHGALIAGGFIELARGTAICLKYSPTMAKWIEIARSSGMF